MPVLEEGCAMVYYSYIKSPAIAKSTGLPL